jgi:hypothetical protein
LCFNTKPPLQFLFLQSFLCATYQDHICEPSTQIAYSDGSEGELALVLSDGKRISCQRSTACAHSDEIDTFLHINSDATEMPIELSDPSDQFPLVISLLSGGEIELNPSNLDFLAIAGTILGISPLLNAVRKQQKSGNIVSIETDAPEHFFGIIRYLWDAEEFEVPINASSSSSYGAPENLTSRTEANTIWESDDRPNPYLIFDFDKYSVRLSSYALRSSDNSTDYRHPQTWLVCGSNDEDEWIVLDEQEERQEFVGSSEVLFLPLDGEVYQFFRYIKVMMTGPNHKGDWVFRLSRIEFFGSLAE